MRISSKIIDNKNSKDFAQVKEIYLASFPGNEQLPLEQLLCDKNYKLMAYYDDKKLVGFIVRSTNDQFAFVLYLAVDERYRNAGYGSAILQSFMQTHSDKCVVLNVEHVGVGYTDNYFRIKRQNFYLRNGMQKSNLIFDWKGDCVLHTLYKGNFDANAYIKYLQSVVDECCNFRKADNIDLFTYHDVTAQDFDYLYDLMKQDFAYGERRGKTAQRACLRNPNCHQVFVHYGNKIIGYICYWEFERFIFLEYFAVLKQYRRQHYGTKILLSFLRSKSKDIVLEVEKPTDETTIKRINFYKFIGFDIADIEYVQPSYHKNSAHGPSMNIMFFAPKRSEQKLRLYIRQIHEVAYQVKPLI